MKNLITLFILLIFTVHSYSQKTYIWKPAEIAITEHKGLLSGDTVLLIIRDNRIKSIKSKEDVDPAELANDITKNIKRSIPNSIINLLSDSLFYTKSRNESLTIKISIDYYGSAFGKDIQIIVGTTGYSSMSEIPSAKWIGVTGFTISIFDNRDKRELKFTTEIKEISQGMNLSGYSTSKKCLNESYTMATNRLISFISQKLIE